ncbi:hypothetical protein GGS23DRAFT_577954 [Durotheca rogersii]|uniref:uncharacterized protein n=1 Tax=Durotheca rogersii TaxID=419775 RepID=UPI00221FA467|nr:uncharacterized protein GGS23DRAFT_577954 [Durotheca rogersii]KAI5860936.1 hypothetical protein GGS23DRAFT_577954 [Durotheca rogersii]
MVSFWPWKGNDSSPSSFEKTLSTLSNKITTTQTQLDRVRTNSRRIKVLWTLYLAFAYLVYAIVLTLVVGWQNLGAWEWTGMAGGPILIYLVRTFTNAYFSFRIESLEAYLKDYQTERTKTIQKLKDATKYDSTLELLEKYGGSGEKRARAKQAGEGDGGDGQLAKGAGKKKHQNTGPEATGARTNIPPPPTANIARPPHVPSPRTPQASHKPHTLQPPQHATPPELPSEEFAPNAGPLPPVYSQYDVNPGPPHWYDRILDLMLGEDEMATKNRIVLICQKCRLVNGQAPPGTKTLADLGTWKCMSCGSLNGEMDEGRKIIHQVLGSKKPPSDSRGAEDRDSDLSSDLVKIEESESDGTGDSGGEGAGHAAEQSRMRLRGKKSEMVP